MTSVARRSVASEPRARDLPAGVPTVREARLVVESGQSAVFAAEHLDRGRVAVKVARPGAGASIHEEAALLTRFANAHLPVVVEAGVTAEGDAYLVTEWIDGRPLSEAVGFGAPLARGTALRLVAQMCRALGPLHAGGWVHGDLKAPNHVLRRDGTLFVIDLGLAREAGTTHEGVLGTPQLCAPEVTSGERIGAEADVYSLGMLLYAMLSGRSPFVEDTFASTTHTWSLDRWRDAHARARPRPLPDTSPAVTVLSDLVIACLAKSPTARPATATVLGKALEAML
ncbi:MAG: serine/threonine-protein kinase [Polyangiaceae bacterium]